MTAGAAADEARAESRADAEVMRIYGYLCIKPASSAFYFLRMAPECPTAGRHSVFHPRCRSRPPGRRLILAADAATSWSPCHGTPLAGLSAKRPGCCRPLSLRCEGEDRGRVRGSAALVQGDRGGLASIEGDGKEKSSPSEAVKPFNARRSPIVSARSVVESLCAFMFIVSCFLA